MRRRLLRAFPPRTIRALLLLWWIPAGFSGGANAASLPPPFEVGSRIEVKGKFRSDGAFVADEIELLNEPDDDEELRGSIESFDLQRGTFELLGFTVRVDATTRIRREPDASATVGDLTEGLRVKVEGERVGDRVFHARKIRIRRNQSYREHKVVGPIEDLRQAKHGPTIVIVVGLEIWVTEGTEVVGKHAGRPAVVGRRLGVVDNDDTLLFGRSRPGWRVMMAGEVRVRGEIASNRDLDDDTEDREIVPEISTTLGFAANVGSAFLYAEIVGEHEFIVESPDPFDEGESDARLGEAYVEFRHLPVPRLAVAIGRQKFNEEREWYYNRETLDAVRIVADLSPVVLEASVSSNLFNKSRNVRDQETVNLILEGRYRIHQTLSLQGYLIDRKDRSAVPNSPRILGLRVLGSPGRHVEFWGDFAAEGGTRGRLDESGQVIVRDVRAWAFDTGVTVRPRTKWDPSFTAYWAVGSGESDEVLDLDPEEQAQVVDRTFRQSGLQRNRDKYNGVVSFRYYGEVLDPELTNLRILTLGAGIRPRRSLSLDVLYHRFRQDEPSRRLRGVDIDADPSGIDTDLGHEWHVAFGYEPNRRVELRLTAGWFEPGRAFDIRSSPSAVARFQTRFRF